MTSSGAIPENSSSRPPIMTVSALNQTIANLLERTFPLMWVSGEISNVTRAASGHWYFTLKDETAQVRAVMFRARAQYADFSPREGDKVEVRALVTLYAPRGDYQLNIEAIRRAGVGNLYESFLRLKAKLQAEGLFDAARKRVLPAFSKTIGIVTSTQAAALRDILITLRRRAGHVQVILYPTPVQGIDAGQKIAQAITTASTRAECDLLLVCRGGGSMEDLWAFNEEAVARAIAACSMPVITGIGHETDFTIADFTADARAPTPTAAAEIAATPRAAWISALTAHTHELTRALKRQLADATQTLDNLSYRLVSPGAAIARERMRLDGLQSRLNHATRTPAIRARFALIHLRTRLMAQLPHTQSYRAQLFENARRIHAASSAKTTMQRHRLATLCAQMELLNPQRTLERGYAIVTDTRGKVIRTPQALRPQHIVNVRLAEGSAQLGIASVQETLAPE